MNHLPTQHAPTVEGILASLPLFRHANRYLLASLAAEARRIELRKAMTVYESGQQASGCYAVAYGLIKLSFHQSNGHEKVLRLVGPGETFGEPVVFFPHPYPVSAEALTDCLLVFLPGDAIFALLEQDPLAMRGMLATLSQRIYEMVVDIESHTSRSSVQRVAAYLQSLAALPPDSAEVKPQLRVRLPTRKSVVASRLGITKETFSRILHELAQQRLVSVTRLEVTLLAPDRLHDVALRGFPEAPPPGA